MDKCKIHIPDGSMVSCPFSNCNISDGESGTRGLSGVAGMIQKFYRSLLSNKSFIPVSESSNW